MPVFKELLDSNISVASVATEPVPEELTECDSNPENLENDNDIDYYECSIEPNRVKTNVTFYRNREANFLPYFKQYEKTVVCNDAELLLMELGIAHYEANSWRLFIDNSKRSLKCVLLQNTNEYAAIPVGHSVMLKEKYEPVKQVLECIKYNQHNWKICVDLKMVNFLLGQQSGYTKHLCFLCAWESRNKANHWVKKYWQPRITLRAGDKNIINEPLVPRDRIILPPLHIKLGLIKQLVKALDKDGECFKYIFQSFPRLSIERLKEAGTFDGPDIPKLMQDENFIFQ